ncbi:MAG: lysophospholipid acyltransferase family protein [Acholeplasma sp.]|nr:lysophospholipid acyltransferase family protein [Acholeplasma sp.]
MPEDKKQRADENEHTFKTIEAKPVTLSDDFDYFGQKLHRRIISKFLVFLIKILFVYLYGGFVLGFKVKHKENYQSHKKKGAVIVSNHVHPFDAFLLGSYFWPKRLYFTMLKTNLGLPFVGKLFHLIGGAPIPDSKAQIVRFQEQLNDRLEKNSMIAVFPEASLRPYCDHIRPFKKGAFRFAFNANVDIIPMVFIFKKPKGLMKYLKKKPCVHLHILKPYTLVQKETKYETLSYNNDALHDIVSTYFNANSDYLGGD